MGSPPSDQRLVVGAHGDEHEPRPGRSGVARTPLTTLLVSAHAGTIDADVATSAAEISLREE